MRVYIGGVREPGKMAEIGRRFIIDGKSLYERYFPDFNREK